MQLDSYASTRQRNTYDAEKLLALLKGRLSWFLVTGLIAGAFFCLTSVGLPQLKGLAVPKVIGWLFVWFVSLLGIVTAVGSSIADIADYHADLFGRARASPKLVQENDLLRERLAKQRRSDLVTLDYGDASFLDSIPDLSLSPTTPVDGLHLSPNS